MRRLRTVALGQICGRGLAATVAAAIVAAGAKDAAAQADAALIEEIGSVAAANEDVIGTPLERAQRQLSAGENLLLYERIETSDVGAGQFIFRDQTSMTVWPNSDIVLDEYIYDPSRGAGSMALSMTRGVLRFIGGGISKTEDVTITTQHAVVAVRGGIAQVVVNESGTTATLLAGDYLRVRSVRGVDVVTMSRSGATASVAAGAAEATFDGISDPAAIAALYGLQTGEGDGGATQEVSDTTVTPLLEASIRPLGSDDRRAPTRRPVSTRGERQVEPESAASPVDNLAQGAEEARTDAAIDQEQDPENGGVQPADPTAPRPIPGAAGARFAVANGVSFVAGDGSVIEDPAAQNIVFLGDAFTAIASAEQSLGEEGVIEATDADGQTVSLPNEVGFTTLVDAEGDPIGQAFVAPDGEFAVQARTGSLFIDFFGVPTPAGVWAQAPAPGQSEVRVYTLSNEAFTFASAPLPASAGALRDVGINDSAPFAGDLLLLGQAGAPVIGNPANGVGRANTDPQNSKWLAGALSFLGDGPSQTSVFGVLTGAALTNGQGQPTLNDDFAGTAILGQGETPASLISPSGIAPGAGGATIFGANGGFFVLGNINQFGLDDDAAFEANPATLTRFTDGVGDQPERFGDTRIATLGAQQTLSVANRLTLPAAGDTALDGVFTAGYAATAGFALQDGAQIDAYLLNAGDPEAVSAGFDIARSAGAVAFSGLSDPFGSNVVDGVAVNFGNLGDGSAVLSDAVFAMRGVSETGVLSGDVSRAAGGAAVAFSGQLATSGLVGDGGLFADGVDTDPAGVRWGFWSGEIDFGATADVLDGRRDRFHLGSFVAGVQADLSLLPLTEGVASYDGFALGHVLERRPGGAVSYVQGGAFRFDYSFAEDAGTITITGILGQSFTAVAFSPEDGANDFEGSFFSADPTRLLDGRIAGAFFRAGSGDTAQIATAAGDFSLLATAPSGFDAEVVGIFAGDLSNFEGPPTEPVVTTLLPPLTGARYVGLGDGQLTVGAVTASDIGAQGILDPDGPFSTQLVDVTATGDRGVAPAALGLTGADGFVAFMDETPGLVDDATANDDSPLGAVSFGSFIVPDVFYVRAAENADNDIQLDLFGAPTPRAVWEQTADPLVTVRAYTLSDEVFSGRRLPLPDAVDVFSAGIADTDEIGSPFLVIAQPGRPLIGDGTNPLGLQDGDGDRSKLLLSYLAVNGTGVSQQSAFGVLTGAPLASQIGQPAFTAELRQTVQTDADGVLAGRLPLGTLDDGAGATVFGPNGEFFVLGAAGAYLRDDAPDLDATFGLLGDVAFGDTRLGILDDVQAVAQQDRLTGVAPSASSAGLSVRDEIAALFDGGYAATAAIADVGGAATPYLVGSSLGPEGVRVGFSVADTGVAIEFEGLTTRTGDGLTDLSLNFGGAQGGARGVAALRSSGRGAYVTDREFGARQSFGAGGVTGQSLSVEGLTPALDPDAPQEVFFGQLSSSELSGIQSLFPQIAATELDNLRWGWWGGELDVGAVDATQADRFDLFHLGSFVTGVRADPLSLPQGFGEATYSGFAVAHVLALDGAGAPLRSFVDGASFVMTFDLGLGEGFVQFFDVAGEDYSGAIGADGAEFFGSLSGATGSGSVSGAFFAGAFAFSPDEAAAVAGQFDITGARVQGFDAAITGVFGADKTFFDDVGGVQPAPELFGALFFTSAADGPFTDADGVTAASPIDANVAVRTPENLDVISDFLRDDRAFLVVGEAAGFGRIRFDAEPTGAILRRDLFDGGGAVIGGAAVFSDGDAFFLEAQQIAGSSRTLQFAGAPSDPGVWAAQAVDLRSVRAYDLDSGLFSGETLPLPAGSAAPTTLTTALSNRLLLVQQPNGPFVGSGAGDLGPDGPTREDSRWAWSYLSVEGAGAAQRSAFGVGVDAANANAEGQPTADILMRNFAQLFDVAVASGALTVGLVDDGLGATSYGENGDYLVLGGVRTVFDGPNPPTQETVLGEFGGDVYADNRLAVLDSAASFTSDAALASALAVAPGDSALSATPNVILSSVFDGGFAAARLLIGSDGNVVATQDVNDVRFGFDVDRNAAYAEISGLSAFSLNFGAAGDEGVFIDDRRFAATEGDADLGALTGQIAGDGRQGSGDPDRVRAALASSELVGTGGLFPAGAITAPDALRWGWFSAEVDTGGGSGPIETAQMHLGAFVTGLQSDFALFQASSGLATYDGFAIGQVLERDTLGAIAASYVDGGAYRMVYDFAERAGTATLSGILDRTFTAAVTDGDILSADGVYTGDLTQSAGTGSLNIGTLSGRFFRNQQPSTVGSVAATAGQFFLDLSLDGGGFAEIAGVFGADQISFESTGRRRVSLTNIFSGASHFAAANDGLTDVFGDLIVDAGQNNFVLIPDRERKFDAFERISDADGGNPVTVAAISGENRVEFFPGLDTGLSLQPFVADGVQIGTALRGDIAGEFFLDATRFDNGDRSLAFFGEATPASVWDTVSGDDVTVQVFDVSNEVFSGNVLPLPTDANIFPQASINQNGAFASNQLLFIPQTNGPFIGDEATGFGFENGVQNSQIAAGFLAISGAGASQVSAFGVQTSTIGNTEVGQPNFGAGYRVFHSLQADDPFATGVAFVSYGLLDGSATGQTFFGDGGRNAVMSSRAPFEGPSGSLDPAGSFFEDVVYGDTRVLTRNESAAFAVAGADRLALAVPAGGTQLDGLADARFDGVLDGGFVAANLASPAGLNIINNRNVGDVRFGFDVSRTQAAAEFVNLSDTFNLPDPVLDGDFDIDTHFGGSGGRTALIDDSLFIAREGRFETNDLTGGGLSAFGETLRAPDVDGRQNGFRGTLASMNFVGDGGLFAADVDTTLENVRVGWWGGSFRFESVGGATIPLGSFVAGVQADPDFSALGDAVTHYSGLAIAHAIEEIGSDFATYVIGGDFEMSYDFGLDAGVAVITDISGDTAVALVEGLGGEAGANFEGDVFIRDDLDDGLLRGNFFRSDAGPVSGVGGQFTAQTDDTVAVTGIVAGDQVAVSPINTAITPLVGYVGTRYSADATDTFVGAIAGPATGADVIIADVSTAPPALTKTVRITSDAFVESIVGARIEGGDLFGVDELRDPLLLAEIPGLERGDEEDLDGDFGDLITFVDPAAGATAAQFGLVLIATPSAQELSFFGLPTPSAIWTTAPADPTATQLRRYNLSNDLASDQIAQIPLALSPSSTLALDPSTLSGGDGLPVGSGEGFGGDLLMVSEPGAALLDPTITGETTATTQDSRWMLSYLVIDDSGAGQGSVFGVLTDRILNNTADQPTLNNALFLSNDSDDLDAPTVALAPYGLLKEASGVTAYGDQGQFLTLTNASQYAADADNNTEPDAVLERSFTAGVGTEETVFGDTRIAVLGENLTLTSAIDRLGLTAPLAGSGLEADGLTTAEMTTVFTGGYAATTGYTTRGALLDRSYLLRSTSSSSVTMAFSDTRNGAVARISGLSDPFNFSVGVSIDQLNFGGAGDESAYVTDSIFAMQATRSSISPFNDAPNSVDFTQPNELPGSLQAAFTGGLASAGLVGDGGLLPAGVVRPRNVSWGWWAGEYDFSQTPGNDVDRRDLFHLGSFVAGVVPDLGAFSGTSQATYFGIAIGNTRVSDGVGSFVEFIDDGLFEMTYDFLTDEGGLTVTGLVIDIEVNDLSADGSTFGGSIESPIFPPFTTIGQLNGSFFSADGDEVAAVGGSFAFEIPGSDVFVTGIFAADSDAAQFVTRTLTPLSGLVGASYFEFDLDGATDVDDESIGDVGGAGIITAAPFQADEPISFARIEGSDSPDPFVRATNDSFGGRTDVEESAANLAGPTPFVEPDTGDAVFAFADPDQFYLRATDGIGDQSSSFGFIDLTFFGAPTPASVWETAYGPDEVEVRVYDLSPDLLSGRQAPVPSLTAGPQLFETTAQTAVAFNHQLLMVPKPGDGVTPRPIVPDPVSRQPVSATEWIYGRLEVLGEGPAQASYLGALTGLAGVSRAEGDDARRQPGLSDGLWVSARTDAAGSVGTARVQQGLLGSIPADSANAGVTSFGPQGDYLVVGNLRTDFFSVDETAQVRFPRLENPGQNQSIFYGDTRLASLQRVDPLSTADRLPLASLYDVQGEDLFTQNAFQAGFNGGFAAANGATVSAGAVLERYTLRSNGSDGVLIGFNIRNAAVGNESRDTGLSIEFSGLTVASAGSPNLGFDFFLGDNFDADTLVTDDVFAARQSTEPQGRLTGLGVRVEDLDTSDGPRPLRPLTDVLDPGLAARAVSRGLVGDGGAGVFAENFDADATNDIDTDPEYLRWGWWSGEAVYDEGDPTLGGRQEQLHLGSFVAGVRSDIADVRAQTGSATYEGFALGHVTESTGAQYVDGGRFTMSYDFEDATGGGAGAVRIDGILDQTVSALVALESTNERHYVGDLVAGPDPTVPGPIGQVRGAFFRGPDTLEAPNVAATAGGFDYATTTPGGVPAAVSGVFGADRTSFGPGTGGPGPLP